MPPRAEKLPPSAFAESSEPSGSAPGENPKEQITSAQEENPQIIATKPSNSNGEKRPSHGGPAENPPPSAFAEASEPGQGAPGDNPQEQIASTQEENPQLIAKKSKL